MVFFRIYSATDEETERGKKVSNNTKQTGLRRALKARHLGMTSLAVQLVQDYSWPAEEPLAVQDQEEHCLHMH